MCTITIAAKADMFSAVWKRDGVPGVVLGQLWDAIAKHYWHVGDAGVLSANGNVKIINSPSEIRDFVLKRRLGQSTRIPVTHKPASNFR